MERKNPEYEASNFLDDFCEALGGLLRDLKRNERKGMCASTSETISIALNDMVIKVNGIPDMNNHGDSLWELFECFHDNFQSWISISGSDMNAIKVRQKYYKDLLLNRAYIVNKIASYEGTNKLLPILQVLKVPLKVLMNQLRLDVNVDL